MYDDIDPASELQWMANELQAAEDVGERVYLISHHPSGHEECSRTWSHQYNRIILRYSVSFTTVIHSSRFTFHLKKVFQS